MAGLTRGDLYSLEQYAEQRNAFRDRVMAHKKDRRVTLGPNATLYFEDRLTIQYQIQEMLRAERTFEGGAIQEELDAYNPLIPDGRNLKATLMLEYADEKERRLALERLVGIEDYVWVRVSGHDPVYAIADEDLERDTPDKTSAVHFLRFEFSPAMIGRLKAGAALAAGVDLPSYRHSVEPVPESLRSALLEDFS